jgi:demethylmenaquinone methyltransferase/2-methoxy-6-polyprenyl-1,4-benzoquinol methylase
MFNSIAGKYDFLNHFLSAGTDIYWRRKGGGTELKELRPARILDIAGTADFAIETLRYRCHRYPRCGCRHSEGMLEVDRRKLVTKVSHRIQLNEGTPKICV